MTDDLFEPGKILGKRIVGVARMWGLTDETLRLTLDDGTEFDIQAWTPYEDAYLRMGDEIDSEYKHAPTKTLARWLEPTEWEGKSVG